MSRERQELKRVLSRYITDTLTYMATAKYFHDRFFEWNSVREKEYMKIMSIKEKTLKIDRSFTVSEGKHQKVSKHIKSHFEFHKKSRLEKRGNELAEVLDGTMRGLQELHAFCDAMEKLAVTSLHVFTENQIVYLRNRIKLDDVEDMISTAQKIHPLLLTFKRDAKTFFLPELHNVEILASCLRMYIDTAKKICVDHGDSFHFKMRLNVTDEDIVVDADHLYEYQIQQMMNHIKQLDRIRMDEHFRVEFLFQEGSSKGFVNMCDDKLRTMQDSLDKLEQCADKLDCMDKGVKISNVAGGSMRAIATVLSSVGLALGPCTAGASLGLTIAGVSLGISSEANSLATSTAEVTANRNHQKTANTVFQDLMVDFQNIQIYLKDGMKHPTVNLKQSKMNVVMGITKSVFNAHAIGKGISLISNYNHLCRKADGKGEALKTRKVKEHPGPIEESGNFAIKLFSFGQNISSVVKDSISLAKGSETKLSKFLRTRVALFHSQINSWDEICKSLRKSQYTQEENRNILKKPFYPVTQTDHQTRQPLQYCEESFYSSPPVTTRYTGYSQNTASFQHTVIQRPVRESINHSPFENYYQTRQRLLDREESFDSSPPVTTRYTGYSQNTASFQHTVIQRPIRESINHSPFENYYQTRQPLLDREESFDSSPPVTTRYTGYSQNTAPFQHTVIQRPIRESINHSPFENYYQTRQPLLDREESFDSSPPVTTRYTGYSQNTAPFQHTVIQRPVRESVNHSSYDNYYQTRQPLLDREESFYSSPPVTTRYTGYYQNTAPFQHTVIQRPVRESINHSPFENYYQTRQPLQYCEESFYSSPPVTTRYTGYSQNTAPFQHTVIQRPIRESINHSPFENYYQTRQRLQYCEESFYSSPPVTTRCTGYSQNTAPFQHTVIQRPVSESINHSPFENYYQTRQPLLDREESFYTMSRRGSHYNARQPRY